MKAPLKESILQQVTYLFNIPLEKAKLIRSNSNWIYECGNRYLRISDLKHTSLQSIEAELYWINFLHLQGIKVVQVLPSILGNKYELFEDKVDNKSLVIVCTATINGKKIQKADWNANHFEALGRLTGQLHQLSQSFRYPASIRYAHWNELHKMKDHQHFPEDEEQLGRLYQKLLEKVDAFSKRKNNYGIIHFDIHFENYLKDKDGDLVLLDFELTCQCWYAYDIASVYYYAYQITSNKEWLDKNFWPSFWQGYQLYYEISEDEKTWIPYFILLRDFFLLGFIHTSWSGMVLNAKQEKLIEKIRKNIRARRTLLSL